jgi:hypothetical protein
MKNAPFIVHIVVAITTTTLFLFQIAMTRIISKSEAAARARYDETEERIRENVQLTEVSRLRRMRLAITAARVATRERE